MKIHFPTSKPQLSLHKDEHVLWITLNHPETSNSITYEMISSLTSTLHEAELDIETRVVVLSGEGKNFCSGGDLQNMMNREEMFHGESNELRIRYEQGIQQISRSMEAFSKPIIAMVNGAAAGAGCDLACMCDLRIGTSESKFIESFVKLGLVPGDGGTFFLQRIVGYAKALEMSLTGRAIQADEAEKIGLLNKIVDKSMLKDETQKLARMIAQNAPIAVQMTKRAMKVSYRHDLNVSLDLLAAYQGITQRTHDHSESLNAMNEKRLPEYQAK